MQEPSEIAHLHVPASCWCVYTGLSKWRRVQNICLNLQPSFILVRNAFRRNYTSKKDEIITQHISLHDFSKAFREVMAQEQHLALQLTAASPLQLSWACACSGWSAFRGQRRTHGSRTDELCPPGIGQATAHAELPAVVHSEHRAAARDRSLILKPLHNAS